MSSGASSQRSTRPGTHANPTYRVREAREETLMEKIDIILDYEKSIQKQHILTLINEQIQKAKKKHPVPKLKVRQETEIDGVQAEISNIQNLFLDCVE